MFLKYLKNLRAGQTNNCQFMWIVIVTSIRILDQNLRYIFKETKILFINLKIISRN